MSKAPPCVDVLFHIIEQVPEQVPKVKTFNKKHSKCHCARLTWR